MSWRVALFRPDSAQGRLRNDSDGRECRFSLEIWWPCEPAQARSLQDSEQRRHLLLPQLGEPVEIEWKAAPDGHAIPRRVRRVRALVLPAELTFASWLRAMGAHIPALAAWQPSEWQSLFGEVEGDLEDTVFSSEPLPPTQHLGVLLWLRGQAPQAFDARHLSWLSETKRTGDVAVECAGETGTAFVSLPSDAVRALVKEGLVVLDVEPA